MKTLPHYFDLADPEVRHGLLTTIRWLHDVDESGRRGCAFCRGLRSEVNVVDIDRAFRRPPQVDS